MRIGIDIDDTISQTNEAMIKCAMRFDKEHVKGRGVKDPNAYTFMDMFYWNVMDLDNFMKTVHNPKFYAVLDAIPKAAECVSKLYDDGNEIIFISRRDNDFKTKTTTKKWLKEHGFKFNKLILGIRHKGSEAFNLGIDFFIDNDLKNVYSVMEYGIPCVLKGYSHNQEVDEEDIVRIEDWPDIYNYVNGVRK